MSGYDNCSQCGCHIDFGANRAWSWKPLCNRCKSEIDDREKAEKAEADAEREASFSSSPPSSTYSALDAQLAASRIESARLQAEIERAADRRQIEAYAAHRDSGALAAKKFLEDAVAESQVKTCPQCAEEVKGAAKICRFCQHTFEVDPDAPTLEERKAKLAEEAFLLHVRTDAESVTSFTEYLWRFVEGATEKGANESLLMIVRGDPAVQALEAQARALLAAAAPERLDGWDAAGAVAVDEVKTRFDDTATLVIESEGQAPQLSPEAGGFHSMVRMPSMESVLSTFPLQRKTGAYDGGLKNDYSALKMDYQEGGGRLFRHASSAAVSIGGYAYRWRRVLRVQPGDLTLTPVVSLESRFGSEEGQIEDAPVSIHLEPGQIGLVDFRYRTESSLFGGDKLSGLLPGRVLVSDPDPDGHRALWTAGWEGSVINKVVDAFLETLKESTAGVLISPVDGVESMQERMNDLDTVLRLRSREAEASEAVSLPELPPMAPYTLSAEGKQFYALLTPEQGRVGPTLGAPSPHLEEMDPEQAAEAEAAHAQATADLEKATNDMMSGLKGMGLGSLTGVMEQMQRTMGQPPKADTEPAPEPEPKAPERQTAPADEQPEAARAETKGSAQPKSAGQIDTDALLKEAQAGMEQAQKAATDAMKDMSKLAGKLFGGFGKK